MRILLDENLSSRRLKLALARQNHDVQTVYDIGLAGAEDEKILGHSSASGRALLTADTRNGHLPTLWEQLPPPRPVLLLIYDDHGLSETDIASALSNLEASGVTLFDRIEMVVTWKRR